MASAQPVAAGAAGFASGPVGYGQPYGSFPYGAGVAQGQFYGSAQIGESVVDRYVVPGETMHIPEPIQVQSATTVMENQVYMEPRQITIKVPRVVMEDHEVSYQVPAMESRFHTAQRPRTVMEEQTITVQEPRTVMEPVQIQVPHVQTVHAVQMHHKVVEYERPRMIPGRMVRAYAGPTQTVGLTAPVATQQYTTGVVPQQATTGSAKPQAFPTQQFAPGFATQQFTQPAYGFPYGAAPVYGAGYGYPVATAAPATQKYQAPADIDNISA